MIDLLKNMVMQQIASKIGGGASNAIAEQGAGAFISMIKEKISGGNMGDLTALLSGGGDAGGMIAGFQEKLGGIMKEQGVPADEAAEKASNVAPDVINSVQEKFNSNAPEDNAFDISSLTGLLGGAGGIMGAAGDMMKGGAGDEGGTGDIMGKVKDLF